MDRPPPSHQAEAEEDHPDQQPCIPLADLNPFSPYRLLAVWITSLLRRALFQDGFGLRRRPVSSAVYWDCPVFREERELLMEGLAEESGVKDVVSDDNGGEAESFSDSVEEECRGSSSSSETSSSEKQQSCEGSEESSAKEEPSGWPMRKKSVSDLAGYEAKSEVDVEEVEKMKPGISEIEMMKERFSKLLLGEDMSGCGKGVCTALAISNAITNLCATLFGQLWRLEPIANEKKSMWKREMEWLLSVSDHIVEFTPSWQTFPDGSKLEVMTCRPRSDLFMNLPALKKLDTMLLEILDSFKDSEFWYVDQGISSLESDGSCSFRKSLQRQDEKWWLPVPRVPSGGLHEKTRRQLQHKRECTNQILKAAMAINSNALAEIDVPESYLDSLPKNGRTCLGDVVYRYINSDQFSPECLLDCLDLSSEHQALEIANRVEASVYVWRRRANPKPVSNSTRANTKSSWGMMVKEMMGDTERRELLADRAESLLLCLKQRYPGLTQTTLDMCKIQCNKDVGKSILESYSRVLESLASNIVARIDDLLYVDDATKNSGRFSSVDTVGVIPHKKVPISCSVPVSSTPYATAYATPSFSPATERSPFINRKPHSSGFGVRKVLTNYLGVDSKTKSNSNLGDLSDTIPNQNRDA